MRTAIVSDLHLGSATGEDLGRDPAIRRILLDEIRAADRLVLLGDVLELRELPLAQVLKIVQPFFEELGEAMAGRRVVLVPGNHDHRLAEPLLEEVALGGGALGLEHRALPAAEPAARIAAWLGEAELSIAYPGAWLRDDVYATHGHYMDCHMSLPRMECVGAAAIMRAAGRPPDPATPSDYERILRPIYGLFFGLAEAGIAFAASRPSERAWRSISGRHRRGGRARQAAIKAAVGAGVPTSVWLLNRLFRAGFDPDLSPASITHSGIAAATEMTRRLRVGAAHRPHPPRRPRRGRGGVAAAGRRPAAQHRQLGLRRRLPPPRLAAGPLLAGDGHLGRGRGPAAPRGLARRAAARGAARRRQPSHSAMIRPISGPASSCRKWEAFSILRGGGKLSCSETRSPTEKGRMKSESAQRTSAGRSSSRRASATALPSAAPGASGSVGRISGKARGPAFDSGLG